MVDEFKEVDELNNDYVVMCSSCEKELESVKELCSRCEECKYCCTCYDEPYEDSEDYMYGGGR